MRSSRCIAHVIARACLFILLSAPLQTFARNPASGDLADVYARFLQTQDSEQQVALGEAALSLDAARSTWTLELPRDAFLSEVHATLGRAYVSRTRGVRADNIEASIKHLEAALALTQGKDANDDAATLRSNLGVAYWNRIRGDRSDNEDRSLSHFETSLLTFTRERHALQWAQVHSNMSAVSLTRHRGDRSRNIEDAISHLEMALTVLTQQSHPQLWAAAHNNLGNAYRVRLAGRAEDNVAISLTHFQDALKVFTREAAPFQWAQVRVAMSAILQNRGDVANRRAAISHLTEALSVFTRDAFPQQWAQTQYELGNANADLQDDHRSANLQKAAAAYRSAMTVLTLDAAPLNHLQITRRLANTLMLAGDCRSAAPVHASARRAFLMLFGQGLDTAETATLVAEGGPMFTDAAYCASERGEISEAVQLANEGRARLLAVSLKLQTLQLPAEQKQKLEALRTAVRSQQAVVEAAFGPDRAAALDRLVAMRQDLLDLVESANPDLPESALALASEVTIGKSALIMPVITTKGAKLLVFAGAAKKTWTAIDVPAVTLMRISEILAGKTGEATRGWIEAYFANYFQGDEQAKRWPNWLKAVDDIGLDLWELFGAELTRTFKVHGVQPGARLMLLPSGRLGILPLGLAQDPVSKRRVLDSYDVVYAPSLEALVSASRQIARRQPVSLAAIINPTGDLPGTEKEGALVAAHFPQDARTILMRDAASTPAVLSALKGKAYWHFASHGTFAWQDVGSSALIMAGAERLSISRLADAGDLGRPRLVVLSACETGLSDIVTANPDEFIGLPGAFAGLGAAGVLGTLWPVSDDATAILMAKFYEFHLDKGLAPPSALRQAQLWLRDATREKLESFTSARGQGAGPTSAMPDGEKPYAHPYYWGGFIYTGL